jgi:hypothetical protein
MMQSDTPKAVAIATVGRRLGASESDKQRWRKKLRENVLAHPHEP